jgi:hypothetical protein
VNRLGGCWAFSASIALGLRSADGNPTCSNVVSLLLAVFDLGFGVFPASSTLPTVPSLDANTTGRSSTFVEIIESDIGFGDFPFAHSTPMILSLLEPNACCSSNKPRES